LECPALAGLRICLKADTPEENGCLDMTSKTDFKRHKPFHLYLDEEIYFVTASTLNKESFFDTDSKKKIVKERLKSAAIKYKVRTYAWVILSNHYHLLFRFREEKNLGKFMGFINGGSSFELNLSENKRGRKIWWNYWDNWITNSLVTTTTWQKRAETIWIVYSPNIRSLNSRMEMMNFSTLECPVLTGHRSA
jgi:REP element-mobilizing transposase RayT